MKRTGMILAVFLAATCPLWASGEVDERRTIAPDGVVKLEMISGSVRVSGWDKDEVEITGRLDRPAEQLEIDGSRDRVSIEVNPVRGRHHDSPGEELELRVPRGCRIEIGTVSAPIEVSDLNGDVSLNSISGDIRIKGDLRSLNADTVSGTILLEDGGDLRDGSFQTVSGTIKARANFQPRGDFKFETVSGTIQLTIPAGLAADFEVSTFSGSIDSDLGPDPRRIDPPLPSQELVFSTGSGGARISVQSFSGMVTIRNE